MAMRVGLMKEWTDVTVVVARAEGGIPSVMRRRSESWILSPCLRVGAGLGGAAGMVTGVTGAWAWACVEGQRVGGRGRVGEWLVALITYRQSTR